MPPRPLIIDCDPGIDDAIALLLALASPAELELLGITTVAGNVPLALTHVNARKVCDLAGYADTPVYAGCPRPLVRSLVTAEAVHGRTGLDGADLPAPTYPLQATHAGQFLVETLLQSSRKITIAAVGPLTNLAVALVQVPAISAQIEELVIMGGAVTLGNVTPSAEFNFYVDPHAAQVVLQSGIPITLMTLDLTHQAIATPERIAAIQALQSPVSAAVTGWLSRYGTREQTQSQFAGPPLHDPCAIAYLIQPELFQTRPVYVEVETMSELTWGRAIADLWGVTGQAANVHLAQTIQADAFYNLLTTRLARLPRCPTLD